MSGKKRGRPKKEPVPDVLVDNKLDAMNNLLMNALNKVNDLERQLQNLSTNFTFHTHNTIMQTTAAEFNRQLYEQWQEEQRAKAEAEAKEKPKE